MKELLELFCAFFKIGAFTFGGGYAMLPMLEKEIVENHRWSTKDDIMDYFAVGQCTPGVIAVNTATFIGFYQRGIIGAIIATLGVIAPSLIIISLIAVLLQNFASLPIVAHALSGIRVAVCVLILNSVIKFWKNGIKDSLGVIIFLISLAIATLTHISTVFVVIGAGTIGFTGKKIKLAKEKGSEK